MDTSTERGLISEQARSGSPQRGEKTEDQSSPLLMSLAHPELAAPVDVATEVAGVAQSRGWPWLEVQLSADGAVLSATRESTGEGGRRRISRYSRVPGVQQSVVQSLGLFNRQSLA